jgi:hypothetical protein
LESDNLLVDVFELSVAVGVMAAFFRTSVTTSESDLPGRHVVI